MPIFKTNHQTIIILIIGLLFATSKTHAEVYKWTDKKGKVHYSDKPIDDKSKKVKMKRQPNAAEVSQAKKRAQSIIKHQRKVQEISNDNNNDRRKEDIKMEQKEQERQRFCKEATREIRGLGAGRVTYTENDDGSRSYLSDKEKNEAIAKLKIDMKKHCQ